jgi:hypothetical protein
MTVPQPFHNRSTTVPGLTVWQHLVNGPYVEGAFQGLTGEDRGESDTRSLNERLTNISKSMRSAEQLRSTAYEALEGGLPGYSRPRSPGPVGARPVSLRRHSGDGVGVGGRAGRGWGAAAAAGAAGRSVSGGGRGAGTGGVGRGGAGVFENGDVVVDEEGRRMFRQKIMERMRRHGLRTDAMVGRCRLTLSNLRRNRLELSS